MSPQWALLHFPCLALYLTNKLISGSIGKTPVGLEV